MPKLSDAEQKRRLAEKFGIKLDGLVVETKGDKTERSQQAEAVAAFLSEPKRFSARLCKLCDQRFATDYGAVAFCSDQCRKAHLERLGIQWSPDKTPADRWTGSAKFPLVVPPEALQTIRQLLEAQLVSATSDAQTQ